jgi:hypothetical protein
MSTHTKHESADQEIGFFMGKSVKFTWRDDMATRIKDHIDPLASTESLIADIPISVRKNFSKADDAEAEVVTIFVGKRDATKVIKILKDHPFPDCEFVFKSMKHANPIEWRKRILLQCTLAN